MRLPAGAVLEIGDTRKDLVIEMQKALIACGVRFRGGPDGDFGGSGEVAVRYFQSTNLPLLIDGKVGEKTARKLTDCAVREAAFARASEERISIHTLVGMTDELWESRERLETEWKSIVDHWATTMDREGRGTPAEREALIDTLRSLESRRPWEIVACMVESAFTLQFQFECLFEVLATT